MERDKQIDRQKETVTRVERQKETNRQTERKIDRNKSWETDRGKQRGRDEERDQDGERKTEKQKTFQTLHSWVGSWPYPQTLDKAGKACQGQTLQLITNNGKLRP